MGRHGEKHVLQWSRVEENVTRAVRDRRVLAEQGRVHRENLIGTEGDRRVVGIQRPPAPDRFENGRDQNDGPNHQMAADAADGSDALIPRARHRPNPSTAVAPTASVIRVIRSFGCRFIPAEAWNSRACGWTVIGTPVAGEIVARGLRCSDERGPSALVLANEDSGVSGVRSIRSHGSVPISASTTDRSLGLSAGSRPRTRRTCNGSVRRKSAGRRDLEAGCRRESDPFRRAQVCGSHPERPAFYARQQMRVREEYAQGIPHSRFGGHPSRLRRRGSGTPRISLSVRPSARG